MDYIRQIVIKHHALLNSIPHEERQRMALIGDGIWKGIAASCAAKKDIRAKEMGELITSLICNKTMARFFPRQFITCYSGLINEKTNGTFFEAAIYLEYNQYGFNYIQEKVHEGLIF